LIFDKNFLFRVGSIGEAPLYLNDEFGNWGRGEGKRGRLCRGVFAVALPVFEVGFGQLLRADDQEVLRVLLLGGLCEIERAGDDDRTVDEDDLVVGNGVLFVDVGRDAGMRQKGRRRVPLGLLTLVEDRLDLYAAFVGLEERLRDRKGLSQGGRFLICFPTPVKGNVARRRGAFSGGPAASGEPPGLRRREGAFHKHARRIL